MYICSLYPAGPATVCKPILQSNLENQKRSKIQENSIQCKSKVLKTCFYSVTTICVVYREYHH